MIIDPPEKRKDYYVSRVSNKKNQPFIISITDAKVAAVHEIANDGGYIIKLWIPEWNANEIRHIDEFAVETSKERNQEWFHNALPEDQFYQLFRHSVDTNQICTALVSTTKLPKSVVWCGEQIDDFENVARRDKREMRKMTCTCTLEIQGLYFYPKKFGVRWIVRNIEFFDPSAIEEDSDDDRSVVDRKEIEAFWEDEIKDVNKLFDEDIAKLHEKIDAVLAFKDSLKTRLSIAKNQESCNSLWDKNLEALKTSIFQYKSGRL